MSDAYRAAKDKKSQEHSAKEALWNEGFSIKLKPNLENLSSIRLEVVDENRYSQHTKLGFCEISQAEICQLVLSQEGTTQNQNLMSLKGMFVVSPVKHTITPGVLNGAMQVTLPLKKLKRSRMSVFSSSTADVAVDTGAKLTFAIFLFKGR